MKVTLQQPIAIKVIVTEDFRRQLVQEAEQSIQKIDDNLARLTDMTPESESSDQTDPHEVEFNRQRIESERSRLYQMRKELEWRIKEAQSIKDGAELPLQTVQGTVELAVGDNYLDKVSTEVILKDWTVVEIRQG